jgi:hypothetical protein
VLPAHRGEAAAAEARTSATTYAHPSLQEQAMRAKLPRRGRSASTRRPSPSATSPSATSPQLDSSSDNQKQKAEILADPLLSMAVRRGFEEGRFPCRFESIERTVTQLVERSELLDRVEQLLGKDVVAALARRMDMIDEYRSARERRNGGAS